MSLLITEMPTVALALKDCEKTIEKLTGYKVEVDVKLVNLSSYNSDSLQPLIKAIEDLYKVKWQSILAKNRVPMVITARFAFIYLAHKLYGISKSEIARVLKRHHTAIMYAITQVSNWILVNDPIQNELQTIIAKLNETKEANTVAV